jgi:glycosyltransferase involved in cell wall biosynthesis
MPRVAIVTPHVTSGDAVCNDVFGMYRVLKKLGFNARIYAADWKVDDPELEVRSISHIGSFLKSSQDILIYHHSMGWESGWEISSELPCRKVIKYHNVTPPEFFSGWSEEYQSICRAGRGQTKTIANSDCDLYLSASKYNMSELIAEGAPASSSLVVPPFHHADRLEDVEPDFEIIDKYCDGKATVLMVGSLFPNKGHAALLEIFATYFHNYNYSSRLFLVGKEGVSLQGYSRYLREMAAHFGLADHVVFAGQVDEAALKSYYLMSDIFVTASEHEGFCVPLIESMAMGIPVLAVGSAAIPETVAGSGLAWDKCDPHVFAESIDTLMNDEAIRSGVGHVGRRRYNESFTNERIEQRFVDALGAVL